MFRERFLYAFSRNRHVALHIPDSAKFTLEKYSIFGCMKQAISIVPMTAFSMISVQIRLATPLLQTANMQRAMLGG